MTISIKQGYVVAADGRNGGDILFVGHDDLSGGFPYFTSHPKADTILPSIEAAADYIENNKSLLENANNSTGFYKINTATIRLLEYTQVFEEVSVEDINTAKIQSAIEKLTKHLTPEEIALIKSKL